MKTLSDILSLVMKTLLKQIVSEQADELEARDPGIVRERLRDIKKFLKLPHVIVIAGIRRVGKSTLLRQIIKKFYGEKYYYFSFEDERLIHFKSHDFNELYEVMIELFDEKKVFFFDEIQNIEGWEKFVRRMQDAGFKFFVSGSNANLLSKELGTRLTGRHIAVLLFPFSFREFLQISGIDLKKINLLKTIDRVKIERLFSQYLQKGGMPEYVKYGRKEILKAIYEDILYRDIVARFDVKEVAALRELSLFYISNIANPVSFNKLKGVLKLGSVNTVKAYTDYLKNSFLFFTVNHYSYSLKQQYIAAKKVYCIDNGLAGAIAFSFTENRGNFLENLVFIELKRRGYSIFYYKTRNKREIDFVLVDGKKPKALIQVCYDLSDTNTREREMASLAEGLDELKISNGLILNFSEAGETKRGNHTIKIMPVWKWLLDE